MARGREGGSAQRRALKMRQGPTWEGLCSPVWKSGVEGSGEHRTVRKQAWGVMEVLDRSVWQVSQTKTGKTSWKTIE